MRDLGLPESVVRPILERLIRDEVIDENDFPARQPELGLGEDDDDLIGKATAKILAAKLGLDEVPTDYRTWRKRLRNRTVEIDWKPGWVLAHEGDARQ